MLSANLVSTAPGRNAFTRIYEYETKIKIILNTVQYTYCTFHDTLHISLDSQLNVVKLDNYNFLINFNSFILVLQNNFSHFTLIE